MNDKNQLLNDIGIVSFVLDDLALYLDTHPMDKEALEYYNHYNHIRHQLVKEFSRKYYPLTRDMADGNMEWRWGNCYSGMDILPWESCCCNKN